MPECNRKQYPYPDECVFLVSGGIVRDGEIDPHTLYSQIFVGRRPDLAINAFLYEAPSNIPVGFGIARGSIGAMSEEAALYATLALKLAEAVADPVSSRPLAPMLSSERLLGRLDLRRSSSPSASRRTSQSTARM